MLDSFYTMMAVVKRNASILGEYNRPSHSLVVTGMVNGVLDKGRSDVVQSLPQAKVTEFLTWFCEPQADIKANDLLEINGVTYITANPFIYETHMEVPVRREVEL